MIIKNMIISLILVLVEFMLQISHVIFRFITIDEQCSLNY